MEKFKLLLDENYIFPCPYIFKFIVPTAQYENLMEFFGQEKNILKITKRPSKEGKYTSVTIEMRAQKSEHVIEIYQKVAKVEGIVSL